MLGRIVGFSAVGTLLLALMGVISYAFVVRSLAHAHQVSTDDLQPTGGTVAGQAAVLRGYTTRANGHRHKVTVDPGGNRSQAVELTNLTRDTISVNVSLAEWLRLLDVAGYYRPLVGFFDQAVAQGFVRPEHRSLVLVGDDPDALLDAFDAWKPPEIERWLDKRGT